MPLFQYELRGVTPEDICPSCGLFPTKPGSQPDDLGFWITTALDLDNLREMGAAFNYPDSLTPREWLALDALGLARNIGRAKDRKERDKQREQQAKEAHLRAMVGRGK